VGDLLDRDWPVVVVWAFFWVGATARGGTFHVLGRGARAADSSRRGWLDRPAVVRAEGVVRRFGAPAVTLSFLTVGVQSAVNLASGVLRMPARRYVPALLVGAAIWATLYVTVGLAVVLALLDGVAWWHVAVGAGVVVLIGVGTAVARRGMLRS
jgi:membrane protein DedA with SNARE-associated domain